MITSKLSHNFPRSFSLYGITTRVFVYILAVKLLKMCHCAYSARAVIATSFSETADRIYIVNLAFQGDFIY